MMTNCDIETAVMMGKMLFMLGEPHISIMEQVQKLEIYRINRRDAKTIATINALITGTIAAIGEIDSVSPRVISEMLAVIYRLGFRAGAGMEDLLDDVNL